MDRPCLVKRNALQRKEKSSPIQVQGWAFKMTVTWAVSSYIGILKAEDKGLII